MATTSDYKKVFYNFYHRLFLILLFSVVMSYVAYNLFESMVITFVVFLCSIFISIKFLGGKRSLRKRQVDSVLYRRFKEIKGNPLVDQKVKNIPWIKGVGFIDDVSQPVWVAATDDGILLFYLCVSRRSPIKILWEEVLKVVTVKEADSLCVELHIKGIDSHFIIPWAEKCSACIPSSIRLS